MGYKVNQVEFPSGIGAWEAMVGGDFDMIIDDGGHTMEQMQISLNYLWDQVKPGGLYVIEDLHSCVQIVIGKLIELKVIPLPN